VHQVWYCQLRQQSGDAASCRIELAPGSVSASASTRRWATVPFDIPVKAFMTEGCCAASCCGRSCSPKLLLDRRLLQSRCCCSSFGPAGISEHPPATCSARHFRDHSVTVYPQLCTVIPCLTSRQGVASFARTSTSRAICRRATTSALRIRRSSSSCSSGAPTGGSTARDGSPLHEFFHGVYHNGTATAHRRVDPQQQPTRRQSIRQ